MATKPHPLTAMGAELAHKHKLSARKKSPDKPSAEPSRAPATGTFVRLESREDSHLNNTLLTGLMSSGLRTGQNSLNKSNVIRFALARWKAVAPDEVQEFSKWAARLASQESRDFVSAHSISLTDAETFHISQLSGQLIKRGMRVGHDGVSNANLARFALVRWEKVTDDDVEQFRAQCEAWKKASLEARWALAAAKEAT